MRLPQEDAPWDLSCPYCHAGWAVSTGLETERIIRGHDCPKAPCHDDEDAA